MEKILAGADKATLAFPGRSNPRDAAVKLWGMKNQLARRNLTDFARAELVLKLKPVIAKKAKERQKEHGGTAPGKKSLPPNLGEMNGETEDTFASLAGVAGETIPKVEAILAGADKATLAALRSGEKKNLPPNLGEGNGETEDQASLAFSGLPSPELAKYPYLRRPDARKGYFRGLPAFLKSNASDKPLTLLPFGILRKRAETVSRLFKFRGISGVFRMYMLLCVCTCKRTWEVINSHELLAFSLFSAWS